MTFKCYVFKRIICTTLYNHFTHSHTHIPNLYAVMFDVECKRRVLKNLHAGVFYSAVPTSKKKQHKNTIKLVHSTCALLKCSEYDSFKEHSEICCYSLKTLKKSNYICCRFDIMTMHSRYIFQYMYTLGI